METLRIDLHDDTEKRVLLAFLDSLNYEYRSESEDYTLNDEQVKETIRRKNDLLSGKATSRPWDEIKKRYEDV